MFVTNVLPFVAAHANFASQVKSPIEERQGVTLCAFIFVTFFFIFADESFYLARN
jgi:hypothetical protein